VTASGLVAVALGTGPWGRTSGRAVGGAGFTAALELDDAEALAAGASTLDAVGSGGT